MKTTWFYVTEQDNDVLRNKDLKMFTLNLLLSIREVLCSKSSYIMPLNKTVSPEDRSGGACP